MPSDPLADAVYVLIERTIKDNYRGADGSYPVSPSAVASLATSAALAAIAEQGYAIVPVPREEPQLVVRNITSWVPYSPELVVDMTGLPAEEIRDRYGDTVLVRMGVNGPLEFRRGGAEPSPAEVRETVAILRRATAPGTAPQPSEAPQDAEAPQGGISGRQDNPDASTGLTAARVEEAEEALDRVIRHARTLAGYRPVEADALAAVILGLDPRHCRPGAALAALTKEKPNG